VACPQASQRSAHETPLTATLGASRPTFAFLVCGFGADPVIDSMITGSFLAKLPGLALLGGDPIPRVGPELRAELERTSNPAV
jgi:hypothetical protein